MSRRLRPLGVMALATLLAGPALAGDAKSDPKAAAAALGQSLESGVRDAQAKRNQGDLAGAVKILSQLMLVNPDDGRVISEYGKVLVQQGRSREALDFLNRAVQLSQNDWTLYSAIGVAYDGTGDYNSAKIAYERALLLRPGEPAVLNNYALSRAVAGDLPAAKKLIADAASSSQDTRVTRNVALINKLTPSTVAALDATPAIKPANTPVPKQPLKTAAKPPAAPTVAAAPPRPLTSAEGKQVVMQAVPSDPEAGPVNKPRKTKPVAKASKTGEAIPALRLANDRL